LTLVIPLSAVFTGRGISYLWRTDILMKKVVAYRFAVRILSVITVLSLLVSGFLTWQRGYWYAVVGNAFFGGCCVLFIYPLQGEKFMQSFLQAIACYVLLVLAENVAVLRHAVDSFAIPLMLFLVLFSRRRTFPRNSSKENRLFYAYAAIALRIIAYGLPLVPLYMLLYFLSYTGKYYSIATVLSQRQHRTAAWRCDRDQMNALWSKIMDYMQKEQPFLNAGYREEQMAKALFTNRAYLSQTINEVGGTSFKGMLNDYRVRYAMAMLRDNPALSIKEVAVSSGFNSSTVFLGVFKSFTGETPQQFLSRIRGRRQ